MKKNYNPQNILAILGIVFACNLSTMAHPRTLNPLIKDFDNFFHDLSSSLYSDLYSRNTGVEIINEKKQLIIYIYVPGIEPKDMELGIDNNTLIIKGTTVLRFSHKDKRDRSRRSFHRYIELPVSVNADGATAKIKHGLLTIVLPKVKESNAKKITIQE